MANTMNTKLAVVLTQVTEAKAKQIGRDFFTKKFDRVAERKQAELKAKIMMDAKAERQIVERRKTTLAQREILEKQLLKRQMSKQNRIQRLQDTRLQVKRQSVSAMGFPGTNSPEQQKNQKTTKVEKKAQRMRYSNSLDQLRDLKASRGRQAPLSPGKIDVDGGDIFVDDVHVIDTVASRLSLADGSGDSGVGSPGVMLGPDSGRPKSRSDVMPPGMFSAERIYDKDRRSPSQIPFGTTATRSSLTPGTVLREIASPDQRMQTARELISSPTPWA